MDLDSLKQTILDIESRATSDFDSVNTKSDLDDAY